MQFAVQFYDKEIIAIDFNYNKYQFYLQNNIFIPKEFIIQNLDNTFYRIKFDSKIYVENEFRKLVSIDQLDYNLFTLHDDSNILTFYQDEYNNKRFILDKIDICIKDDNIQIGEYEFELESHHNFIYELLCCFFQ